jgi:hypothetical protein
MASGDVSRKFPLFMEGFWPLGLRSVLEVLLWGLKMESSVLGPVVSDFTRMVCNNTRSGELQRALTEQI